MSRFLVPALDLAKNVGYLSINGSHGTVPVDEGDEVTFTFVPGPGFPAGTVTAWELYLDGVLVDGEASAFTEYVKASAAESDAGTYRLELTVGSKVVRVSAVLTVRNWLLTGGVWSDSSVWNDSAVWIDG